MRIRRLREADADAVLAIYAPIVRTTAISFEWEPPDAAEMRRRIRALGAEHPWLGAEDAEGWAGYATAIGGIALPNPACVALHEALGFVHVATFPRAGFKFGAWHDVGFWRRELAPALGAPRPPEFPRLPDPLAP